MKKKILAFLLALSMVFSTAMPVAAEGGASFTDSNQNVEVQVEEPQESAGDSPAEETAATAQMEEEPSQQDEALTNTNGVLTYSVSEDGTSCTITDCDDSASGTLEIPKEIDGY